MSRAGQLAGLVRGKMRGIRLCVVMIAATVVGCGSAHVERLTPLIGRDPRAVSASAAAAKRAGVVQGPDRVSDRDNDADHNDDDYDVTTFGRAAGPGEGRAIADVVWRYRAAMMAGDGARVCALLTGGLMRSFSEELPRADAAGVKGCGVVVDGLLKQIGGHSDAHVGSARVTKVRIGGLQARALVRLPDGEERYLPLSREGGAWKIAALFDLGMI